MFHKPKSLYRNDMRPELKLFLSNYESHQPRLRELCELVCFRLNDQLKLERERSLGELFQAMVLWRVKDRQSLERKVRMRDNTEHYRDWDHIRQDIFDLAGVRIKLYWPGEKQRAKIHGIICELWKHAEKVREYGNGPLTSGPIEISGQDRVSNAHQAHSHRKVHPGYQAVHYRVEMREDYPSHSGSRYKFAEGDQFEIQVVSAFANGWAEAEHDIQYKDDRYGRPPRHEQIIFDSISGSASSNDLLLEMVQESVNARTYKQFESQSHLNQSLREMDVLQDEAVQNAFTEKCSRCLFGFLKKIGKDYPLALRKGIIDLGFPDCPNIEEMMETKYPNFRADKEMMACICLIHNMLESEAAQPGSTEHRYDSPVEKGRVMLAALILLQNFAGDGGRANEYLRHEAQMNEEEKRSLEWILTNEMRVIKLNMAYTRDLPGLERKISSAWGWFETQSQDEKSICGLALRLAAMGAFPLGDLGISLEQLSIGKLIF